MARAPSARISRSTSMDPFDDFLPFLPSLAALLPW